ncbi:hypothetical protein NliqN6_1803 [Naganishia liquefaciens]|uniref:C2 domain-containing protein n=1 Tax=Naganishia liquefaciens TaxID=104408 RepID=A0A8H3TR29_9TREE|nr:hypothetical protein NliqN6_1803 [Naganishia liquefaciens]
MSNPIDPKLLGELAIVVIRAQHLSDRSKIGKHHPYVVLKYGNNSVKTPVVKKGGQHPTFDAEVRFKITEDTEDIITRQPDSSDKDTVAPKKGRRMPKNKSMVLSVYADDPKEPKLVGETVVDLTTVFEKCEHDDMFELKYKNMFAGEIYLEMTYFINDAPPIPKKVPKPTSWMDYGTAGPLPSVGSSNSRPYGSQSYMATPPDLYKSNPQRRGSQSGSISTYNQVLPPTSAYVPPPAFPGKQPPPREQVGSIRHSVTSPSGPLPMVPALPSQPAFHADTYSQPNASHSHRHSLPGAIPQHGHWQNDQAYPRPSIPSTAPAVPPQPLPEPYPAYNQHSLPVQYPTDRPGSALYTPAAPPSSSFPRLNEMAMALPPFPPPPLVELPGRTTPLPSAYSMPSATPRPSTLPIPESYHYPPPDPHVNPYLPQPNVSGMPAPANSLPYAPPRPPSTHIATYPLIDNRPPSSMATAPPPERPYSSASAHYPPTVTSSYHVSSAVVPPAPLTGSHWPPNPAQYAPPAMNASAVPEIQPVRAHSPYTAPVGQPYEPQPYLPAGDHNEPLAYPPPVSAATWTTPEPDTRPGRTYLRSLGVGGAPVSAPPGVSLPYPEQSRSNYTSSGPPHASQPPHNANYGHAPDQAPMPETSYHQNYGGQAYQPTYSAY